MSTYYAHSSSCIDEPCTIGEGTHIWHFCHIMQDAVIGSHCNIGQNVMVGKSVRIGNGVKIQNNVSVYEGVTLEDDVFVGPSVVFTNVINPRSAISRKHQFKSTLIKRGTTIGANATIVCGVIINEYAFIGAGAVVTKDVPAHALMVGNPARQTGWISEQGYKLMFDEKGVAVCEESGETYVVENGSVRKNEKQDVRSER